MMALNVGLVLLAGLVGLPIAVLVVECLAALWPRRAAPVPTTAPPRSAILVPAHNEAAGIEPTLRQLLPELQPGDRLLVIADNCDDDTAAIARGTGATVLERQDQHRRGKGYALDFGLRHLANDPPDVVVVVDADCLVQPGALAAITRQASATQAPSQSVYLLTQPAQPGPKDAVSALAFTVKNWVRPLGLANLGLPCLLTGTGMAFPWATLQRVSLASGNIVEDMQLSLDLAIAGAPTRLCPTAHVRGALPQQRHAAQSQRTRWEHGHLRTLLTQVPRLIQAAVKQGRFDLLALALDLAVPPLSLLVMLWLAGLVVTVLAGGLTGFWWPALILGVEGALLFLAIVLAWAKFARADLPAQALLAIPLYILWKIPLYFSFLLKPQTKWVRTDRDPADAPKSGPEKVR